MKYGSIAGMLAVSAAISLLTTGCEGGGGGLSGFFGGSSSGSSGESFSVFTSGSGGSDGSGSEGTGDGGTGSGGEGLPGGIATVHSPEPATVAFFGAGFAGLACSRRRKRRSA